MGQFLTIYVRDHDTGPDPDDDVDVLTVPFEQIEKGQVSKLGWWHLYGLSTTAEREANRSLMGTAAKSVAKAAVGAATGLLTGRADKAADALTKDGSLVKRKELKKHAAYYASTWRGKVLLSMRVFKPEEKKPLPEKLLKQPVPVDNRPGVMQRVDYELRAAVLLGSDVDYAHGFDDNSEVSAALN